MYFVITLLQLLKMSVFQYIEKTKTLDYIYDKVLKIWNIDVLFIDVLFTDVWNRLTDEDKDNYIYIYINIMINIFLNMILNI